MKNSMGNKDIELPFSTKLPLVKANQPGFQIFMFLLRETW